MKAILIIISALTFTSSAHALTICSGETFSGTMVTVTIVTTGATGAVQSGSVTIAPSGDVSRGYEIKKEEISQFFESQSDDGRNAVVGLVAYINRDNPVSIRYSGTNYQENLKNVLRNPMRPKEQGNEMRVWKGHGYPAEHQLQFRDVVCQVTLEP